MSYLFFNCLIRATKLGLKRWDLQERMRDEKCMKKIRWKMCKEDMKGRIILKWILKKKGV